MFTLLRQITIFVVLVDTIPTVFIRENKVGFSHKTGIKDLQKTLLNPDKIIAI